MGICPTSNCRRINPYRCQVRQQCEDHLDAILCPSKSVCLVEATRDVFRPGAAMRVLFIDALLNKRDIVGEVRDYEAEVLEGSEVSVSNKANFDREAGVRILDMVYNFTQCILGALDPGVHGAGAIEDEAKIESLLLLL